MKLVCFVIVLALLPINIIAQDENESIECFALRVELIKGHTDTIETSPYYHPNGFYILKDGIYNFIVKGKKYDLFRVLKITSDSLYIAFTIDSVPELGFKIKDITSLKFVSLNDGVTGWPHIHVRPKKYDFSIVCQHKYCQVPKVKICISENCESYLDGYQYMTAGYGWKPIYEMDGQIYMLDESRTHKISR